MASIWMVDVAEWQNGGMAEWQNGEMVGWLPTYYIHGTRRRQQRHQHLLIFYSIDKLIGASPGRDYVLTRMVIQII
jgi:hypothetical protein